MDQIVKFRLADDEKQMLTHISRDGEASSTLRRLIRDEYARQRKNRK